MSWATRKHFFFLRHTSETHYSFFFLSISLKRHFRASIERCPQEGGLGYSGAWSADAWNPSSVTRLNASAKSSFKLFTKGKNIKSSTHVSGIYKSKDRKNNRAQCICHGHKKDGSTLQPQVCANSTRKAIMHEQRLHGTGRFLSLGQRNSWAISWALDPTPWW